MAAGFRKGEVNTGRLVVGDGGLDSEISDLATVSSWGVISQPHAVRPSGDFSSLLHRASSSISLVADQGGGRRHNEKSRNLLALIRRVATVFTGRPASQLPLLPRLHICSKTPQNVIEGLLLSYCIMCGGGGWSPSFSEHHSLK